MFTNQPAPVTTESVKPQHPACTDCPIYQALQSRQTVVHLTVTSTDQGQERRAVVLAA